MDATEQIKIFTKYFDDSKCLLSDGRLSDEVILDFHELSENHSNEIADALLDEPEDVVRAAQKAIETKYEEKMADSTVKEVYIRITNVPASIEVKLRELRAKHLDKLCTFTCMVRRKTYVQPKIESIRFECQSCGNIFTVLQLSDTIKEPKKCQCGRTGGFRKASKDLFDAYAFVGEENPEEIEAGIELYKRHFMVKKKLAEPKYESKIFQGCRVKVIGIPREAPKLNRAGVQKVELDMYIEVNNIEILQSEYLDISLTEQDRIFFTDLVNNPKSLGFTQGTIMKVLSDSMFSDIEGLDDIKDVLVLQNVGGEAKNLDTGTRARGDIHVLLSGDPGVSKSNILKIVANFAPKARYVTGGGASGTGLTATVVKDELMGGWSMDPGALPLTNHGVCCIDELDKMKEEDTDKLHEALEQQTVTISKASVQATLKAETTVLAAANPKFGRFDLYLPLVGQIDLPPAMITRFDYIFIMRDIPDEVKDRKIAKKMLSRHRLMGNTNKVLDRKTIRKFFAYAKTFHPYLGQEEEDMIADFFVKLRTSSKTKEGEEQKMLVSPRYIEVVRRTADAHAKLNLKDRVQRADIIVAFDKILSALKDVAINPETGKLEIDIIDTGYTSTQRNKNYKFMEVIERLSKIPDYKQGIPQDILVLELMNEGFGKTESEVKLGKLAHDGELYEPRTGFYLILR